MDKEILSDMQRLSAELDMSLSSLTRLLYVFALSIERVGKDIRDHIAVIEDAYPDGVPEEEAGDFVEGFFGDIINLAERWASYVQGLLTSAGIPGIELGPQRVMTVRELLQESITQLGTMKKLGEMLDRPLSNDNVEG